MEVILIALGLLMVAAVGGIWNSVARIEHLLERDEEEEMPRADMEKKLIMQGWDPGPRRR